MDPIGRRNPFLSRHRPRASGRDDLKSPVSAQARDMEPFSRARVYAARLNSFARMHMSPKPSITLTVGLVLMAHVIAALPVVFLLAAGR